MIDVLTVIGSMSPILFMFIITYNKAHALEKKLDKTIEKLLRMDDKI